MTPTQEKTRKNLAPQLLQALWGKKKHVDDAPKINFNAVQELIKQGADINYLDDPRANSPLMLACLHWRTLPIQQYQRNVDFLLQQGAHKDYRNSANYNAISWIALHGKVEHLECLLSLGFLPFERTYTPPISEGATPAPVKKINQSIFHFIIKAAGDASYDNFQFLLNILKNQYEENCAPYHKKIEEFQRYYKYWQKIAKKNPELTPEVEEGRQFHKIGQLLQTTIEQTILLQKIAPATQKITKNQAIKTVHKI